MAVATVGQLHSIGRVHSVAARSEYPSRISSGSGRARWEIIQKEQPVSSNARTLPLCLSVCGSLGLLRGRASGRKAARRRTTAIQQRVSFGTHAGSPDEDQQGQAKFSRIRELRRIAAFVGPALSIPLADPLMTLIDTLCVGRAESALQLAALGPNTVMFNFINYGFTFMGIATLSLVTSEIAEGRRTDAARAMAHALSLAVILGLLLCLAIQVLHSHLLSLAGASSEAPFFAAAVAYLRIRAISAPAMLVVVVAQSALLAQRESVLPAAGIFFAGVVNIIGDILLIFVFRHGLVGAAWATVLSEVTAAVFLLFALPLGNRLPLTLQVPWRKKHLTPFVAVFGPLVLFKLTKNLCYGLLQSRATALGAIACAAHQSVWVLWVLLSFAGEPLSQAAQVLLPARQVAARLGSAREQRELRETSILLIGLSLLLGAILGTAAGCLPAYFPQFFTRDTTLWAPIRSLAIPSAIAALLSCISCPVEGALLARRDLQYMARSMLIIFGVLLLGLHRLKSTSEGVGSLALVWWWLVLFFALRLSLMVPRLQRANRRA